VYGTEQPAGVSTKVYDSKKGNWRSKDKVEKVFCLTERLRKTEFFCY
jgi:hypothetical protein